MAHSLPLKLNQYDKTHGMTIKPFLDMVVLGWQVLPSQCQHQQFAMSPWQERLIVINSGSLYHHNVRWLGWFEIEDLITSENDLKLES